MTFKRFAKLYIWIYQFRLLAEEERELWQFSMTRKMAYLVFTNRGHLSFYIILFMIMYDELIDWVFTVTGNVYLLIHFGDQGYHQVPTIIRGCDKSSRKFVIMVHRTHCGQEISKPWHNAGNIIQHFWSNKRHTCTYWCVIPKKWKFCIYNYNYVYTINKEKSKCSMFFIETNYLSLIWFEIST